jgi:hypothetical protein
MGTFETIFVKPVGNIISQLKGTAKPHSQVLVHFLFKNKTKSTGLEVWNYYSVRKEIDK